jgi:hypothetical protein
MTFVFFTYFKREKKSLAYENLAIYGVNFRSDLGAEKKKAIHDAHYF